MADIVSEVGPRCDPVRHGRRGPRLRQYLGHLRFGVAGVDNLVALPSDVQRDADGSLFVLGMPSSTPSARPTSRGLSGPDSPVRRCRHHRRVGRTSWIDCPRRSRDPIAKTCPSTKCIRLGGISSIATREERSSSKPSCHSRRARARSGKVALSVRLRRRATTSANDAARLGGQDWHQIDVLDHRPAPPKFYD